MVVGDVFNGGYMVVWFVGRKFVESVSYGVKVVVIVIIYFGVIILGDVFINYILLL